VLSPLTSLARRSESVLWRTRTRKKQNSALHLPCSRKVSEFTLRSNRFSLHEFARREYRRRSLRAPPVSDSRDATCCRRCPANLRYYNARAPAACGIRYTDGRKAFGLRATSEDRHAVPFSRSPSAK